MSDTAIAGMVIGVTGIFCFALLGLILGVLALYYGRDFFGRVTKEGVVVSATAVPMAAPANQAAQTGPIVGSDHSSTRSVGAGECVNFPQTQSPLLTAHPRAPALRLPDPPPKPSVRGAKARRRAASPGGGPAESPTADQTPGADRASG